MRRLAPLVFLALFSAACGHSGSPEVQVVKANPYLRRHIDMSHLTEPITGGRTAD